MAEKRGIGRLLMVNCGLAIYGLVVESNFLFIDFRLKFGGNRLLNAVKHTISTLKV